MWMTISLSGFLYDAPGDLQESKWWAAFEFAARVEAGGSNLWLQLVSYGLVRPENRI
jgi:hypothetical protein